ncbi:hypothetical protein [Streptomyces lydicus]|uniref:hypothetical protein n=1 Tax=Streptomyces lydicus TaxID=47763 RepID=UPI0037A17EB0
MELHIKARDIIPGDVIMGRIVARPPVVVAGSLCVTIRGPLGGMLGGRMTFTYPPEAFIDVRRPIVSAR